MPKSKIGQRISVVGCTGSGKTTFADAIGKQLQIKHIELDSLHWDRNWTEAPIEVFRERVANALDCDTWVIDGNYSGVRDIIWHKADTVVWLDYPLPTILARLLKRTIKRVSSKEELWNGNKESFHVQFFTKDSLFLWALNTHKKRRQEYPELFKLDEYAHLNVIHLHSPKETNKWWQETFGQLPVI